MKDSILNLQCATLEELEKTLAALAKEEARTRRLATLNLYGPQVLVRQFDLPLRSSREIKNALKLEAAEAFSLLPDEIEIDYQVLSSLEDKTKGVFVGIPKKLFNDYISYCSNKITLQKITANTLSRINFFLQENKIENEFSCIIDFFKEGIMNLAVFDKGACVLLREVYYESVTDAEKEILYFSKYAVSKSMYKKFDGVYVLGDLLNKDDLISSLERELNAKISKNNTDAQLNAGPADLFFDINLIGKYNFSQSVRQRIFYSINAVLLICLLLFLFLSINTIRQYMLIKNVSGSYGILDYNYAKYLQGKFNLLKNAD